VEGIFVMGSLHRRADRVLLATSDERLRAAILKVVRVRGASVTHARSPRETISLLTISPDLLLFDVHLPGADLLEIVDAANTNWPIPIRMAMGIDIPPEDAFELARRGVSRLFALPIRRGDFWEAVDEAGRRLALHVLADAVGVYPVHEVQTRVREFMTAQALAMSHGNRGMAARLLGLSRQAVHQGLRRPLRFKANEGSVPTKSGVV
jgi:CheY-like chemotaxis protein